MTSYTVTEPFICGKNEALTIYEPDRTANIKRIPIIALHGMWATARRWENYGKFFSDRGFRFYAPTLRYHYSGNGNVSALGNTSVNEYIADIVELIENLQRYGLLELGVKPILFGHSMGGLIAQKLSAMGASSLTVLLNSAPPAGIKLHADIRYQIDILRYLPKMLRHEPFLPSLKIFARYIMNGMPERAHEALYSHAVHESGRAALEIRFGKIDVDFSAIKCPMLIIGAERDRIIPHKIAKDISKRLTGNIPWNFIVYEKFAHWIQAEWGWGMPARDINTWIKDNLDTR